MQRTDCIGVIVLIASCDRGNEPLDLRICESMRNRLAFIEFEYESKMFASIHARVWIDLDH